jgi:hypothetical protein
MKKSTYKTLICLLTIPILLFVGNACSEQEVVYPDQGNNLNAAFSKASINTEVEAADGGIIKVEIVRGNLLDTEATVGIKLTLGEDIPAGANIRLAQNTVQFAKGENRKEVLINYNIEGLEFFKTYPVTLSFSDSNQDPIYGANATSTVNISRKLIYEDYGDGVFTSTFFEVADIGSNPKTVKIQKAQGAPYFLVKDLFINGYDIKFVLNDDLTQVVEFVDQQTGYVDSSYGMISARLMSASISGKTISFSIRYYVTAGNWGNFAETLVLP